MAAALSWPGRIERLIVAATFFLLAFDLPNAWFRNRDERIPGEIIRGGDATTLAIFVVLFALSFSRLINNGNLVLNALKRDTLLLGFLAWIALSVSWSADPGVTARRTIALLLTTMFATFLVVRFPVRDILAMAVGSFGIGTVLSYALIFGMPSAGVSQAGWIGMFDNKNSLGRHEVLATVVFLVGAATLRRWRLPLIILATASVGLVIGAGSSTAIVGLLAILGNFIVFRAFRSKDTLFGAVAVSMAATGAAAIAILYGNLAFITGLFDKDITLTGRTDIWLISWESIAEKPFLGHGWDAYWTGWYGPSHEIWISLPWLPPHAHNAILDYLLVLGIPGTFLFLAMFARAVIRSTRYIRDAPDSTRMFPILMVTYAFVFSITEAGIVGRHARWTLFVVAVLIAGNPVTKAYEGAIDGENEDDDDAPASPEVDDDETLTPELV